MFPKLFSLLLWVFFQLMVLQVIFSMMFPKLFSLLFWVFFQLMVLQGINAGEECLCGKGTPPDNEEEEKVEEMKDLLGTKAVQEYGEDYIVNGFKADSQPWFASLAIEEDHGQLIPQCGGALINRRYVLSAAHCFCPDREMIRQEHGYCMKELYESESHTMYVYLGLR